MKKTLKSKKKRNKASTFILPMMGGSRNLFFYDKLQNCYLSSDLKHIVLIYRHSKTHIFQKFIRALRALRTYENEVQISKAQTAFIFKILKQYKGECKKFLRGEYSKFHSVFKLRILDFHDKDIEDTIGQILYRSPSRKERMEEALDCVIPEGSELYSIPQREKEVINIKKFNYECNKKADG